MGSKLAPSPFFVGPRRPDARLMYSGPVRMRGPTDAMNLHVSTRSTAPFSTAMPRGVAEVGLYSPDALRSLPRSPVMAFSVAQRPSGEASSGFWRVAKTITRSTYLPSADGQPGPDAYTPRRIGVGGFADMSDKAANHRPRSSVPSPADAAWPHLQQQRRVVEYRVRTLGDGSRMMLPSPGVASGPPPVFIGRETSVLKKHRELEASRAYAQQSKAMMDSKRTHFYSASNPDSPPSAAGRPLRWPVADAVFF